MRAWRPAIGGRCSSVGSRLSTKQTYVYIGDADSATPASKYPPPELRRGTSRSVYASQEQNALRALIHPRENLMPDFFFIRLAVVFVIFLLSHPPLSFRAYCLISFFFFPQRSSATSTIRLSSSRFPRRWRDGRPLLRRRRNVPIKSESHVLPISRQLNLVHAHIAAAIAATRALCQGTPPANSADRRTLDEYSMPRS